MAEGWAKHFHSAEIDACSAGTDPHGLNPLAVRAMADAGVDIAAHTSNTIADCDPDTLDLVVTVCSDAHENCPVFMGSARVIHRGFDDPPRLAQNEPDDDAAMVHYERVRDEIKAFVEQLPHELVTPTE